MKKKYTKPVIAFEDFALNTNVAASCEKIVGTSTQGTCGVQLNGWMTIFINAETGCNVEVVDGTTEYNNDGYCYHVPMELYSLFNS